MHLAALALVGAVLVAAGQPLFAEDTWWHLAMGRVYAASGPWLAADPLLHTAAGPPAPAAWASDVALHAIQRAAGFTGLRVVHALLVAAILAAAWRALHRASGSRTGASLGTALFAALAAYRLFQLRPELVTILATTVLVGSLAREPRAPSLARLAALAFGFALWANAHGGFVLGLALLGAAAIAARSRELLLWFAAGCAGSLLNPIGWRAHALYLTAGSATPDLAMIVDEWAPLRLLALPVANRPPSELTWAITWALWIATPCAVWLGARARSGGRGARAQGPALLAVAAAGLVAPLAAVRLAWLGIAPLCAIASAARALLPAERRAGRWLAALASVALLPAFAQRGDWPALSSGIDAAAYARPYPPEKFYAHPVWFLRDAGLEGRLWNDYLNGNFLGYWLAPRLRAFVNGSLNVPRALIADGAAIRARADGFLEILDHHAIDVFFATGVPAIPRANHPPRYTTTLLEDTPGWTLVFRCIDAAVYLRANDANRANLARVAAYYANAGVPFDAQRGLDLAAVIHAAPDWAAAHGILPSDWRALDAAASDPTSPHSGTAQGRVAAIYALLGLYEHAAAIDQVRVRESPRSLPAARRLVWSLLHQGGGEPLAAAADHLAALAPAPGTLAHALASVALALPAEPSARRALVATLPMFTEIEAQRTLAAYPAPPARSD